MKIQTKTTILFTALTSLFFIAVDMTVYYFVDMAAFNDFHKRLELRARISAKFRFEKNEVSTESFKEIQREYLEKLSNETPYIFSIDKETKQILPSPPPEISKDYLNKIVAADGATVFSQKKFRHYAGLIYHDETGDFIVIKSAINQLGMELLHRLRDIMIITLLCSALLIYIIGYYFAKGIFKPFRAITAKVKMINENNLHLRLEENEGSDEIAELTRTINKMIDRIEMAFETQNNFISNASHELRTPLTTIVGEAELALARSHSEKEYQEAIETILKQALKLELLTKGLLNLAQTGFDGKKLHWEKLRLDELVSEVKANIDSILPANNVIICIDQMPEDEAKLYVNGSADILKIAIGNIILNACKYSDNQKVEVKLSFGERFALITVKDTGIGIPETDLKHIYDPFFRASNTQNYEGYGIGMPLSNNIIRLHKGKLDVLSRINEGTIVVISLPLAG